MILSTIDLYSQYFQWARVMNGNDNFLGVSIAIDLAHSVYTTGCFKGTVDFDAGTGTFNLTSSGGNDVFISKLDSSGNFVWAKIIGSIGDDVGTSIVTDNLGNIYITGYFGGTVDFDPGAGIYNLSTQGARDIFILKIDSSGNFIWAKTIGGTGNDGASSITIDALNNVYITGYFEGTVDFNPNIGTYNLTSSGIEDIFISKLDSSGNFVWAKCMGGVGEDEGSSIAVDDSGNVYTTGHFGFTSSGGSGLLADFDPGTGTYYLATAGSCSDIFISKLNSSGNFVWAKGIGGYSNDGGTSLAFDSKHNVYLTGSFYGIVDFDPDIGVYNLGANSNGSDIFILKLNTSGNFVWAKCIGAHWGDWGNSIAFDGTDNLFVTGYFCGTVDFDPSSSQYNLTSIGSTLGDNIYVLDLDTSGNFIWAKNMTGDSYSTGNSLAVDNLNNIYITGWFNGTTDFDPGIGTCNLTTTGIEDVFVLKLGKTPTGFEEIINANCFKIYPNPSKNQINIKVSSSSLRDSIFTIADQSGKTLVTGKLIDEDSKIDISSLPNGIYLFQIGINTEQILKW